MTQLALSGIAVEFGATTLLKDVTFTVGAGERWGFVGRNGTGKTTVFRILLGQMQPTRGAVARDPGIVLSLLEQHRDFEPGDTVWTAAAGQFAELLALERSLGEQATRLSEDASEEALSRYGHDLERFERQGGYQITPRVDAILHGLGFDPEAARSTSVDTLSGGERGRVGLARQLASPADVLLLDEPTNHLDLETTRWLEQFLRETRQTVLLVSHDRAFLAAVVDHVLHFEAGTATPYSGSYEDFVRQRAERRLSQQRAFDRQQKVVERESDYIARNIAGVNSRQAKGRRKRLERMPRLSALSGDEDTMALRFGEPERGPDRVISAVHAELRVPTPTGERTLLRDFTATLNRGEVLGLIGPNGTGKSTLLRALAGEHPLTSGELKPGASIRMGYYRQDLSQVPLDSTIYDAIADMRPMWERRTVQGHLGRFGFSGDEVQRRAGTLSGGERARLALAMLVLSRANFLVLDEPTNHLDVESIEALEDAIEAFEGTVLIVSHDRALLTALTTRLWILQDAHMTDFDGNFAEWETVSAERAHAAATRASEEEALQRVHERQRTTRQERAVDDTRSAARRAQRAVEELEGKISQAERAIETITRTLEDPGLYVKTDGVAEAKRLGQELDRRRGELDRLLTDWSAASEQLDSASKTKR